MFNAWNDRTPGPSVTLGSYTQIPKIILTTYATLLCLRICKEQTRWFFIDTQTTHNENERSMWSFLIVRITPKIFNAYANVKWSVVHLKKLRAHLSPNDVRGIWSFGCVLTLERVPAFVSNAIRSSLPMKIQRMARFMFRLWVARVNRITAVQLRLYTITTSAAQCPLSAANVDLQTLQ